MKLLHHRGGGAFISLYRVADFWMGDKSGMSKKSHGKVLKVSVSLDYRKDMPIYPHTYPLAFAAKSR